MIQVPNLAVIDTVARTLWGEARGQGYCGMYAVACVIRNRVNKPGWWGASYFDVCVKPYQFSCRNPNDVNKAKLLTVTTADPDFANAMTIATQFVNGSYALDITNSADSYYQGGTPIPAWAMHNSPVAVIGQHRFYIVGLTG